MKQDRRLTQNKMSLELQQIFMISTITICVLKKHRILPEVIKDVNSLLQQISENPIPANQRTIEYCIEQGGIIVTAIDSISGRIVGLGTLIPISKINNTTGRIEHIAVDKKYRGQGISRLIMNALVLQAEERCIDRLDLNTEPRRIEANALYQSLGFKKRETNTYRLQIPETALGLV